MKHLLPHMEAEVLSVEEFDKLIYDPLYYFARGAGLAPGREDYGSLECPPNNQSISLGSCGAAGYDDG